MDLDNSLDEVDWRLGDNFFIHDCRNFEGTSSVGVMVPHLIIFRAKLGE